MTFGSTLRELTTICGVKRCNLAAALGYDPSYVSRWINDVKLPAVHSDGTLFRDIGVYLAASTALPARRRAAARFALDCPVPEDDAMFARAVAELLAGAYRDTQRSQSTRPVKTGRENASFARARQTSLFPEAIFEALREHAANAAQVDIICTTPIHAQFKNDETFFRQLRAALPRETAVRVLQFVDMDDFVNHLDLSCRSFCYLMGQDHNIQYEFYELKPGRSQGSHIFLIRDSLLLQYDRNPFSRELMLLESGDPTLVSQYSAAADRYILNRRALNDHVHMRRLLDNQFFLDYFMQPHCRCLLKRMQPLFFPEQLQRKLMPRERAIGGKMGLFLDGSRFFQTIVCYKPAFVDYVYTGRMSAFGRVVEVPREDRLVHLQTMLDRLSQSPEVRLCILSARNPICNYEDQSTSLFLSPSAAFSLKHQDTRDQVLYTLSSPAMIRHMNTWLDHMESLPPDLCLTGEDAMDYISRCIKLL